MTLAMEPEVHVQLAGLRRVLEQVVAPAVGDAFAAAQLRGVLEALDALARKLPGELARLEHEHADLQGLFAEAARSSAITASALRARLAGARAEEPPQASGLTDRVRAERALLCDLIEALAAAPQSAARDELRGRVRAALRAKLERAAGA